jgi:serine protease AprX
MLHSNERGAAERGLRSSALWGTGSRGGDSRSSVLWGKGGRGITATCVLVCALAAPLAATASPGKGSTPAPTPVTAPAATAAPTPASAPDPGSKAFIAKGLLDKAKNNPGEMVDVIIQSAGGTDGAQKAFKGLGGGDLKKELGLVGAVSVSLPAKLVEKLQNVPGLIVTPDAVVKVSGTMTSSQLWPYESGNSTLWTGDQLLYAKNTPAIAIVDSGVQQPRPDFGNRIVASVNLSTLTGNTSMNDERGHGTFVAGIAAGAAPNLTGAAPTAPIVSIKVMDANGMARTSDVINACQWILDHKDQYNIRVANFSMHSSYGTNFYRDPLDRAVEKLWFAGVTVVAAAGNYGTANGPSGVLYSPGNDPFVITVGALDIGGSARLNDDTVAPWSAYGYTNDGFYKPEVAAPGRYMVGPIAPGSTITQQKAANMVGSDRIQLSGTSFAAPVVSGTAAQILARHPDWSPDQVKGSLMRTARRVWVNPKAAGVGEITVSRAAAASWAPNPNLGLDKFVVSDPNGGSINVFDAQSWVAKAKGDMSWNSLSWTDQSWSDLSWVDQSWNSLSWVDQSWSDLSWVDLSWVDQSWSDSSQEDAAEGDSLANVEGYAATPSELDAATTDPDLNVPVDPIVASTTTATTTSLVP